MAIYLTENLVYWHMPKTGGIWVSQMILRHGGWKVQGIRRHQPIEDLPSELRKGRRVFGTVRDPWSWYASWYQHGVCAKKREAWLRKYGNGSLTFKDVLYGATHPHEIDLPDHFLIVGQFDKDQVPGLQESFKVSRLGLCSWMFQRVYGYPLQVDFLLDTPQLHKGLGQLLGISINPTKYPPQNAADHRPKTRFPDPKGIWDNEMREWVRQADTHVIHLMGYTDPFEIPPRACLERTS